ncbi:leucoanthocyanidin reductase-like [Telopea speciosissima]|uniref:leucoanthocyanidin reductase-like n=1 Tax=Telopea speciosissima TaxID=54955 RepID=UPI001CC68CB5|nr:leucoanthocyanidin reductase-like [Telopea speciosissima]
MTMATAAQPASAENRTLIVGATGFIGRFVTEACLETGRTTYVLVRSAKTISSKAQTIKTLHDKGAIIVHGSINDREFMEKLLRENKIEVVISAVGGDSILDQLNLINAIKAVGTIKRFLPSEFGHDIDRADPVEPGLTMYLEKRRVRRAIEETRIPFTYICCNSIAAWPYHDNTHPAEVLPPLDRFQIYGDGTVKAYFVAGTDIGKFTMKAVDDERTVNKSVHFRPAMNFLNINELASLWEKKLGRTLPRETVTEEDLLVAAAENEIPRSIVASFTHDIFIKGCQINFPIDGNKDLEASSLYPDIPFRSMADCFVDFAPISSARVEESAAKEDQLSVAVEAAASEFVMRIDQPQQPQVVGDAPNPMVEVFAITASCA